MEDRSDQPNPDVGENEIDEDIELKQWHPIFLRSIKEALKDAEPGQIEIIDEVSLSSKPLKVDIIVIQHNPSRKLKNPISQIFKRWNIIEYKSPAKNFAPKDFDMGIAYARMYNVLYNPKEDLLEDYSITYIASRRPKAMFSRLQKRGLKLIKDMPVPGIYQLEGEMYTIQIVVLNEMEDQEIIYPFAVFLTGRDKGEKKAFLRLFKEKISYPENENIENLIEFAVTNDLVDSQEMEEVIKMFNRLSQSEKGENLKMLENSWFGQILVEKGMEKGVEKGMEKSKTEVARRLILSGMNLDFISKMTELPLEEVERLQKELMRENN